LLRRIEPLLFASSPAEVRNDVRAMRQRTKTLLQERGRDWGEVKLGEGSIRDVEFVVQYLQLAHGAAHPQVRSRTTLEALDLLLAGGLLPARDHRVLVDGYIFLRTIEHHLQMMHYRQTHALPNDVDALAQLARRLGFAGPDAGDQLVARYEQYRSAVRAIYVRYLGSSDMNDQEPRHTPTPEVDRHLARMDPAYADVFTEREIQVHAALASQLDQDNLVDVYATPLEDASWRVTIVGYDYPGELSLICGLLYL
jgi:glutamate-ammonia-ligase adenylyltransferase